MNTLTFTVTELKPVLAGLGKLLPRHGLPILQHLRFTRDDAGIVSVHANGLDTAATYTFSQPAEGPVLDLLMPYDHLNRILKTSKGQISLIAEEPDVVIRTYVSQTPLDQKFAVPDLAEWPPVIPITALPVPLSKEAVKAIREAMDFASEDTSRLVINSVHLDVSDKQAHYVVGTNGRALFSANSFKFALKESITIPTHKFWLWNGLPDVDGSLTVQPPIDQEPVGWLRFQLGPWTLITRQREGSYPNWKQVVPSNHKVSLDFSPDAVTSAMLAAPQLPGDDTDNRSLRIRVTKDQVYLEAGTMSLPIPEVKIDGSPITISLNREYLLLCFRIGLNRLLLIDDLSPLVFTKDGKRAVVMPLRPAEATQPQPTPPSPETKPMPADTQPASTPPTTAIEDVLKRISGLKDGLKELLRDLQEIHSLIKQVEREKKVSDKEVEVVREKLREIQNVKL